jgi:hypothetical protein
MLQDISSAHFNMAKIPMSLEEGAKELLKHGRDIAVVGITSRDVLLDYADNFLCQLELHVGKIPEGRVFKYTPPNNVGNTYRCSLDPMFSKTLSEKEKEIREERIPEIKDSSLNYLVCDDIFETGGTLCKAISSLEKQGVETGRIWFAVQMIIPPHGQFIDSFKTQYLDRPEVFFRYVEELEEERKEEFRRMAENMMRRF